MAKNMKKFPKIEITPKNAIALKCGQCCCFDWTMVAECPDYMCAIWTARPKGRKDGLKSQFWDEDEQTMIARPIIKKREGRVMSEEEKIAAGERLRKLHKEKKK